mmetsp:Transcript_18013/g.55132  ORF Transcript_18013/g.55132 Transcript_18013/m.55132 type:complete len:726 (+) Transcript_18013:535-2712(+)
MRTTTQERASSPLFCTTSSEEAEKQQVEHRRRRRPGKKPTTRKGAASWKEEDHRGTPELAVGAGPFAAVGGGLGSPVLLGVGGPAAGLGLGGAHGGGGGEVGAELGLDAEDLGVGGVRFGEAFLGDGVLFAPAPEDVPEDAGRRVGLDGVGLAVELRAPVPRVRERGLDLGHLRRSAVQRPAEVGERVVQGHVQEFFRHRGQDAVEALGRREVLVDAGLQSVQRRHEPVSLVQRRRPERTHDLERRPCLAAKRRRDRVRRRVVLLVAVVVVVLYNGGSGHFSNGLVVVSFRASSGRVLGTALLLAAWRTRCPAVVSTFSSSFFGNSGTTFRSSSSSSHSTLWRRRRRSTTTTTTTDVLLLFPRRKRRKVVSFLRFLGAVEEGRGELVGVVGLADGPGDGLEEEGGAARGLQHEAPPFAGPLDLGGPAVDADEDADVEVDAEGEHGDDVAAVLVGVGLDGVEDDAEREFVQKFGLGRHRPVAAVAGLRVASRQHGHVGGGDAEQAAVRDALDRAVEERRAGAVRIQVDHVVRRRRLPRVLGVVRFVFRHVLHGVRARGPADASGVVLVDVARCGFRRVFVDVVRDDGLDARDFFRVPNRPQPRRRQSVQDPNAVIRLVFFQQSVQLRGRQRVQSFSLRRASFLRLFPALALARPVHAPFHEAPLRKQRDHHHRQIPVEHLHFVVKHRTVVLLLAFAPRVAAPGLVPHRRRPLRNHHVLPLLRHPPS